MSLVPLPQEVIGMVVDELREEYYDLRSCLRVSRAFSSRSRKHLFVKVILRPNPAGENKKKEIAKKLTHDCQRFSNLLSRCPHIGDIVRELEVIEGSDTEKWVANGRTLALILQSLTRLERIRLHDLMPFWCDLPRTLKNSLRDMFRLPELRTLELDGVLWSESLEELWSIFVDCRKLKNLSLRCFELHGMLETDTVPTLSAANHRSQLDSLTIWGNAWTYGVLSDYLLNPSSPLGANSLRRLSVVAAVDSAPIFPLVRASARTLDHLQLNLLDELDDMPPVCIIHDLRLRLIDFSFSGQPFLHWISSVVTEMNVDQLEKVVLGIPACPISVRYVLEEEWEAFDAVLTRPVMSSLQMVTVELYHFGVEDLGPVADLIRERMPVAEQRGMLHIDY